ncbi:vesicular integral-membrane protein VIP36 [Adelges cooleyi]|uniref:vesicular integral-membrane protein VIP36 n=1 Tax=Adelges cooleyi TaxID=133065 RepID=UPI00217F4EA9|nr:vesicular integral-membrane protein VIP36 [Adelges cooleyi]
MIMCSNNFKKFRIHLIFFSFLSLVVTNEVHSEWNTKDYMKREHSLLKPYQGSGITVPNWDFIGSTIVTDKYVRLTPDLQSKSGSIWNAIPCHVHNWELQVQFRIHGKGKESLHGDGMAIWYTRERMVQGPVFGNKDFFEGLAVIIDTYSNHNGEHNHQHPYISSMVNNGSLHYDHDRDGTHTELAGCEVKARNIPTETHIAIRYSGNTLSVMTDLEDKAVWKPCFTVEGVELPTGYYFGFTAATGDLSDNHEILAVRLYEVDSDPADALKDYSKIIPSAKKYSAPREHIEDNKNPGWSGLKIFFVVIFVIIAIGALIVGGVWYWEYQQSQSHKTFY